jgi:hypothetical protein
MPREDEPGFDPFEPPDEYRKDYPVREPLSVGAALPRSLLDPPDSPKPPAKQQKCGKCFKEFKTPATWFNGKWAYAGICLSCADGNTLPTGFNFKRSPVRDMSCSRCGIRRGVDPTMKHNLWHYELTCPNCGEYTIAIYRIQRVCDTCHEDYAVNDRWPRKTCKKCDQQKSKAF